MEYCEPLFRKHFVRLKRFLVLTIRIFSPYLMAWLLVISIEDKAEVRGLYSSFATRRAWW